MDQNKIIIRHIELRETSEFNSLKKQIESESPYMLYDKDENDWTDEQQLKFIKGLSEPHSTTSLIVAQMEDELVGFIALIGNKLNKRSHIKEIVMGVLKNHARKGIGAKLLDFGICLSKEKEAKRLELSVISENINAISLYKKMGFQKEGSKEKAIFINGNYIDEDYYALIF